MTRVDRSAKKAQICKTRILSIVTIHYLQLMSLWNSKSFKHLKILSKYYEIDIIDKYSNKQPIGSIYDCDWNYISSKFKCFQEIRKYFNNNVFKELMEIIFHPKNIKKFKDLGFYED